MMKIYLNDSYCREFDATVLSCEKTENGYGIVLDKTAFFPEAGGQKSDRGSLHDAKVLDVQIENEIIKHFVDKPLEVGKVVKGEIDFERRFEFVETDDQLRCIHEIKKDMEKPYPMDRLLCGDVGFGKTEVAMRAAYKAVLGGKQVALLVPTTLLALQHYQTIVSRMRAFAVNVDMLSRFRTPTQQKKILDRVRRGNIDVLVGTHRLISKDVEFRDLGLLIVDEEQRFGVTHKERLKQMSGNIDVLTLTATPIPRTLNMALGGIRDISVLDEAPGDRLPVQTYVLEHDELIIIEAIRRELRRGGQVFYLHNRVETIDRTASRLMERLEGVNVAVAHGQMGEEMLGREGHRGNSWELLDYGTIVVHVFTEEAREFYSLERLWADAESIDISEIVIPEN